MTPAQAKRIDDARRLLQARLDRRAPDGWRGVLAGCVAARIIESNYAYQVRIRAPILAQMTLTLYGLTSARWRIIQ